MTSLDRFVARVDDSSLVDISAKDLRKRLLLLRAELEQLAHDTEHVSNDLYGMERFHHLRTIERERKAAVAKTARYAVELESRSR